MSKNAMRRNLRQSIVKSIGRYLAIILIIALGAGLFVGLLMTKTDMVVTGQIFMDQQDMFDLRMVGNYGWTEEYVEEFSQLEGVKAAEGVYYIDLIANREGETQESVYRFYTIPDSVDKVALRGGRMPERDDECLADGFHNDNSVLGTTITISDSNDTDSLDKVVQKTFTIVGYVSSPLYMDMNRGTTSVGSGSLEDYFYVPKAALDNDYYTEIHLRLDGNYGIYTEEYNDFLDAESDRLKPQAEQLNQERFLDVKEEAEEEYNEGYQEYLDGVKEYEDAKADAEKELADAEQELKDSEEELEESRQQLIDGEKEIQDGREQIEEGRGKIEQAREELSQKQSEAQAQFAAARQQLDAQKAQLPEKPSDETISQARSYASRYESLPSQLQEKQGQLEDLNADYAAAETEGEKAEIQSQITELQSQCASISGELESGRSTYETSMQVIAVADAYAAVQNGYAALESQQAAAEKQIADAKALIDQNEQKLWENEIKLNNAEKKINVGWGEWAKGRDELAEGWEEYEKAKKEAEEELADAEAELKDAEEELLDARDEIDSMDTPELIILDRNSNVGYNNLDSSSDIVAGVSRVFPVFFILIAALVCITTMSRMIDEERTQIGTLKALGYTDREIMNKYLVYSGSGAVLGCALGIAAGCTIFPQILWKAYCIMLNIQPNVVLTFNWPLSLAVLVIYSAVMLFVTWWCCHKTLAENPAELIRPKAPEAGKQIFVEKLPFWKKISFLNKVTIRNIFRYKQRLAMMLIGIGGCTALLLTGFGLRDSISNIAGYQFENVTKYDISVYFREEPSERQQEKFRKTVEQDAADMMFYHQSSVELEFDDRVKEIYLISGGDELTGFIDFHEGDTQLSLPGKDQVLLSAGVAENLGIREGDEVILRNSDLEELRLTVSGVYDNHVDNYAIVSPETIVGQWDREPDYQMAFVCMKDGADVHALSAAISDLSYVMNVSVSEDLAATVGKMMEALDLVVWVIVFCAGLLAVTVLYNLTNININERIREIATIKVLGFNASETAAYVFKENLALTVVGALLGLVFGKLLLTFVMSQIKIDMVWFTVLTEPISYIWSIGLTLLSAVVVDFVFYFRLDKINMAEALKSVE
ncbi:MAG: FtsX-like permease family protein [Eubacteriales bacterium]|nr:FtsX-like permease family protein [Eubacteriales bacterium]